MSKGPSYGYFMNASETSWLIVKPEYLDLAYEVFRNTGITPEGKCHLGASIYWLPVIY